jgi:hypothetical protein
MGFYMKSTSSVLRWTAPVAVLFAMLVVGSQRSSAQASNTKVDQCGVVTLTDGTPVFFNGTTIPLSVLSMQTIATPTDAAIQFGNCLPLPAPSCGHPDLGEAFQVWLFSRLASTDPAKNKEATDYLATIQRSDFGLFGTDTAPDCKDNGFKGLLDDLEVFFTDAARRGDGDTAAIGFLTALIKYKSKIPPDVFNHVLSLIDLKPGLGSVETISFGADPVKSCLAICPAVCAITGGTACLLCAASCPLALASERVTVPETENHRNMIYVSQYLANQLLFDQTGQTQYDNSRNGYRTTLINRMKDFVRNDFVEYNAHNYEDFDMFAILSLYSNAEDPAVKAAAKEVLDYLSAKVAVSSNDLRRSTPFRRRNEDIHNCDELILQNCSDPQTAFYMALTGQTGILGKGDPKKGPADPNNIDMGTNPNPAPAPDIFLPKNTVPGTYATEFLWVAATDYKIDPVILDLFKTPAHRSFYQFFHYARPLDLDGFNDANDELYFGSPSYLISAGGHPTHFSYTADIPFPINFFPKSLSPLETVGSHPGSKTDLGFVPATVLMPTLDRHNRGDLIRFWDPQGENMCVAPNFACGLIPPGQTSAIPGSYVIAKQEPAKPPATGVWKFIDQHSPTAGAPGYYVAVYEQDGFGFFEVYDTSTDPLKVVDITDFENRVHKNNDGRTFSKADPNTYTTLDNSILQFTADAHIVTINGNQPYDPSRTNGTIINNDGHGTVTISNPALGKKLTLDATIPPTAITIPGPLSFPDTCVGSTSHQTLDVCNDGNGTDNLQVFNILSPGNTQFAVTEPTSGYPVTIGSNFCFPFQAEFTPTMTGAITSQLTISSSDPSDPIFRLGVSGNGLQQGIATIIAAGGNFGHACVGSHTDLILTISNTGGCDLIINGITSSSPEFGVATAMSFPITIHAGVSLQVPLRFQPVSEGPKMANITVMSNDPNTPNDVIAVTGQGQAPKVSVTGTTNFGNVCAGTVQEETYKICNLPTAGTCKLNVTNVSLSAGCKDFTIESNPFPEYLGAEVCGDLVVRFTPTSDGAKTCNLIVSSTDPVTPVDVIPLTGTTPIPSISLSPALAFPPVVEGNGKCAVTQPFPVRNTGICPLTVNGVTLGPPNPEDYGLVDLPKQTNVIPPGGALSQGGFGVRFQPVELNRNVDSAVDVTYISDPILGTRTTLARNLCGEGVFVGARVLVTLGGVPVSTVDRIQLIQVSTNTVIDNVVNATLKTITPKIAKCVPFQFQREYGTVSDPKALAPGTYQVKVTLTIAGKQQVRTVTFTDNSCGFAHPVVVAF